MGFMVLMQVEVSAQYILDIGRDTSVCTNSTYVVSSNIIDSTYQYKWKNGDSTYISSVDSSGLYWLEMKKDTTITIIDSIFILDTIINGMNVDTFWLETMMLDSIIISLRDTILIEIKNKPICNFTSDPACFGIPIPIVNDSDFDTGSSVIYLFENNLTVIDSSEVFYYDNLANGTKLKLRNIIIQPNGCRDTSQLTIECLLTPSAALLSDSTCTNEEVIVSNQSINTTNAYTLSFKSNEYNFSFNSPSNTINLNTLVPGLQEFEVILANNNGCNDTINHNIYIFPIEPREISGLPAQFCNDDAPIEISGNFNGGVLTGTNVFNLGGGKARYTPLTVGNNLLVFYTYTDENNCTESTSRTTTVHPIPFVDFTGLDPAYCHKYPKTTIEGSQTGGVFSEQWLNGVGSSDLLSNGTPQTIDFTPSIVGEYIITYYYIDGNGCDDEKSKITKVNPLPDVDLSNNPTTFGSDTGLMLSPKTVQPGVFYEWSNGATTPTIFVYAPGYYELMATFATTGCMDKDSIFIEILENTFDASKEDFDIYPNPFQHELHIACKNPRQLNDAFFELLDEAGKKVPFQFEIRPYEVLLRPESERKGMYYVSINNSISPVLKY
jgi:hypothetical protein